MGNRKQPFGYKIALGEVEIHTEEARVVQQIFKQYLMGESLQRLADTLQEQGVAYVAGRTWNKNTIARILEDNRYAGEKGYPKLIDQEQLRAVAEKRAQKAAPPQKTEQQKALRKLCTKSISATVEQQVVALLNGLLQTPALIEQPLRCHPQNVSYAQTELDEILEQQPIDEEHAKSLILKIAAEQYEALGNEEYETVRLRRRFAAAEELSAELLRSTISEVIVDLLDSLPFTVLFISGNHENFDLLKRLPIEEWHGGKVQFIRPHVIHLLRGQVFEIEGYTFFTMGGASSHDIEDGILRGLRGTILVHAANALPISC